MNPPRRGFAFVLSLLLIILLTVLAFAILLSAGNHYSAVGSLFENQNARIACDSALQEILNENNYDSSVPHYWFNPANWTDQELIPFAWDEYTIRGSLDEKWDSNNKNWFQLSAQKGKFLARQMIQLRQLRLEDFALFTDQPQSLASSTFFEGMTFCRPSIQLDMSGVLFRGPVFCDVSPPGRASYRDSVSKRWQFPSLAENLSIVEIQKDAGLFISQKHPLFWNDDQYQLSLDLLQIAKTKNGWNLTYDGVELGTMKSLQIHFDDTLAIIQNNKSIPFASNKDSEPLYISSSSGIEILSNIAPLETTGMLHPLALIAGTSIRISKQTPRSCRIMALLIALGSELLNGAPASLIIEPGEAFLSSSEKDSYIREIIDSTFILEETKKSDFVSAIRTDTSAIWFRGTVALASPFAIDGNIPQLHFENSHPAYSLLPSMPFLVTVPGSQQWL